MNIKEALGTALADEPPLRIHRDDMVQHGRKRLLRRRAGLAGGVAMAVTALAFGGWTLGGEGGGTAHNVGSGSVLPSSSALTKRTSELTAVLAAGQVVPEGLTTRAVGGPDNPGPLVFRVDSRGREYAASADLVDARGQEGSMHVMVGSPAANSPRPGCQAPAACDFRTVAGQQVQLTTVPLGASGEVLTMAYVQLEDGSHVYAMTSNVSSKAVSQHGKAASTPTIDRQPLSPDDLVKIVTLPGLRF